MANYLDDAKITAQEIMALDDEQLDQYLKDNDRFVHVKDPDNLDEVFIQRLRTRTFNPKSVAVDPLKLTARLLDAPTYKERPTRCSSPATTVTPPYDAEEDYQYNKRLEIEAYHDLVHAGGRPSHPLGRMEDIVKDPGEFREILSFWQTDNTDWQVFSRQEVRWLNFRRIQRVVREGPFMDDNHLLLAVGSDTWDEFAREFPSYTKGTLGFTEYVQSAKERLARNGFTRPFELDRDITKQNKLVTWIEFMNWEYMWYERYVSWERRGQRRHDKAWKILAESGELKPGETEDELWTFEHSLQRSSERHSAQRAVESAKRDLASAKHALISSHTLKRSLHESKRRAEAAQAKLAIAEETHSRVARRNDCISSYINTTKNHRIAKDDAARHLILLRWILQQIPLIEREASTSDGVHQVERTISDAALPDLAVGGTKPEPTPISSPHKRLYATSHSPGATSSSSRGVKRSRDESGSDPQSPKKAKRDNVGEPACDVTSLNDQRGTAAASRYVPESQSCDEREGHAKETYNADNTGHQQASHRAKPRRSVRIAEQKLSSKKAPPDALPLPPKRRGCRPQLPSPPLSLEGSQSRGRMTRKQKWQTKT